MNNKNKSLKNKYNKRLSKRLIFNLKSTFYAELVTAGAVLIDVGVGESFDNIQLAQNSQQLFTGDHTVQQRLLRFAYISGHGHEPNRFEDTTKIQIQSIVTAGELIIGRFTTSIINHGIQMGRIRRHLRCRNSIGIESAHSTSVGGSESRIRLLVLEITDNVRRFGAGGAITKIQLPV